jgi:hypothetical protein
MTSHDPTPRHQLKFRLIPGPFSVVRLAPGAPIPEWANRGVFTSITRTSDELSIVCPAMNLPANANSEVRWSCYKLEGPFAFSQTGILLSFIEPLSARGIGIFVLSTFDTDYVMVQQEFAVAAQQALEEAGHEILS